MMKATTTIPATAIQPSSTTPRLKAMGLNCAATPRNDEKKKKSPGAWASGFQGHVSRTESMTPTRPLTAHKPHASAPCDVQIGEAASRAAEDPYLPS